jgi:hypothetical protein
VISKLLAGTAVAAAAVVGGLGAAGADPSPYPSPFNVLSCDDCPQTAKKSGPAVMDQLNRGLRAALGDPLDLPGPDAR